LRKLREGDSVEAKGTWDEDGGVFLVYEIEKLPKPHSQLDPFQRGRVYLPSFAKTVF
jgi:hypothetical protein